MKKKELVSIIHKTKSFSNPNVSLEQYCIDAVSAVDILYYAGFEHDDIKNHIVVDLGAGTGRLSIIAAYLQALLVISIDIDRSALTILKKNCVDLNIYHVIHPINANIDQLPFIMDCETYFDKITTIMNPPFGVQTRKADRSFLNSAFDYSDVIYSIHLSNSESRKYLKSYIEKNNWKVDDIYSFNMVLEKSFQFHTQKRKEILVDLYRLIKKEEVY